MLNKIYIHYINTLFVLESFIISCWLLKGKKKSVSESASLLKKNWYRNRPRKIMIGASLAKTKQKYDAILYIKAKTESQDLILIETLCKPAKYMHMLNLIGC